MRRILFALALLLLLAPAASLAAGQLAVTGKFNSGGNEFDFAKYTENGSKDKIAHSVKVGAASAAAHDAH